MGMSTKHNGEMSRQLSRLKAYVGMPTEPDVEEIRARIDTLKPISDECDSLAKAVSHSRKEDREFHVETAQLKQKLENDRRELSAKRGRVVRELVAQFDEAQEARAEIATLEATHRELLELPEVDLDTFTLTCQSTVINDCDPSAEHLEVTPSVFDRECVRRRRISFAAYLAAREKRASDVAEWKDANAYVPPARQKDLPPFHRPTWSEIVSGGRIEEFESAKIEGTV